MFENRADRGDGHVTAASHSQSIRARLHAVGRERDALRSGQDETIQRAPRIGEQSHGSELSSLG